MIATMTNDDTAPQRPCTRRRGDQQRLIMGEAAHERGKGEHRHAREELPEARAHQLF